MESITSADQPDISIDHVTAILDKYQFGEARHLNLIGSNITNAVYDIVSNRGESFVLKVNFGTGGEPLERDQYVTALLNKTTELPVSDLNILDRDEDAIPHPYLLLNKLPGESGLNFFNQQDESQQIKMMRRVGFVIGTIHNQTVSEPSLLDNSDLRNWQDLLNDILYTEESLREGIEILSPDFYPRCQELMRIIKTPEDIDEPVLLWGDANLWNFLFGACEAEIQITGIFDFQNASFGTRIFDFGFVDIREEFHGHFSTLVFDNSEYLRQFYDGYQEASGITVTLKTQERRLQNVIQNAKSLRFFWRSSNTFPPVAPDLLNEILRDLKSL